MILRPGGFQISADITVLNFMNGRVAVTPLGVHQRDALDCSQVHDSIGQHGSRRVFGVRSENGGIGKDGDQERYPPNGMCQIHRCHFQQRVGRERPVLLTDSNGVRRSRRFNIRWPNAGQKSIGALKLKRAEATLHRGLPRNVVAVISRTDGWLRRKNHKSLILRAISAVRASLSVSWHGHCDRSSHYEK